MKIVVGITGGIAAYKTVSVIRQLVLAGHDVHVVATENALRFVGRPTLEAISHNAVNSDLYEGVAEVKHVGLGQSADLILVAPATANTIAKLAVGLVDDLLSNTILASKAPLVIAPAMHSEMWQHPATMANITTLRERGTIVIGPEIGQLTGNDSGAGRMSEPEDIVSTVLAVVADQGPNLQALVTRDLSGFRFVISAGGTREPLDPVRFLGNRSTGKQGLALAQEAAARGADVTLIGANLEVPITEGYDVVRVQTAEELEQAMQSSSGAADVIIMAAAVADYRPETVASSKIKKEREGDRLALTLVRNPDILAGLVASRRPGQIIIGFAAETEADKTALLELGRTKVARKGSDYLVLNRVGWSEGFASEENTVIILDSTGVIVGEASGSKRSVARRIVDVLSSRLSR